jgi:BON domain
MPGPAKLAWVAVLGLAGVVAPARAQQAARTNAFGDPFVQVTRSIAQCPVAEGPLVTAAEARSQAHFRAEKGTTCYLHGRCRLPNAFLYDKDIVSRVARFIELDPRFADSSIWLLGQRRWVYLKGCAASAEQARALEAEVRLIDDVETVVNELMVGTTGPPPYDTVRP